MALFGLAFGSFLNVCICRIPAEESVIFPGSRCPNCGHAIRWRDNIPVLSYCLLRGRCRDCHKRISVQYPMVEVLTAAIFVLELARYGLTPELLKNTVFALLIVILIFTDLRERRIPHVVTLFGIIAGLMLSTLIPIDDRPVGWVLRHWGFLPGETVLSFLGALTGAMFGGGLFYGVGEAFYRLRHKEGLGFGDVMLMLMTGTFLGPVLTLLTILLGSLLGTAVALILLITNKKYRDYQWPYGTFLGIAAIYASLGGEALIRAYLHWAGFR